MREVILETIADALGQRSVFIMILQLGGTKTEGVGLCATALSRGVLVGAIFFRFLSANGNPV
jgi:hypothetical protein